MDSALARLGHLRRTLPEHAELARLSAERDRLAADLVAAETAVSDLELEQARAEADLQPVRDRLSRNERRIADGSVPDPKALSSMVAEVAHLKKRIGDLEDAELEVMEELESATAHRARLSSDLIGLDERLATVRQRRDEQLRGLDVQVREQRGQRSSIVPDLPADLLALYVKVGTTHGGVGAAELRQRRCTGCQLEVNAADLRRFAAAAADEVLRCEECSRILVRTADSGI